MVRQLCSLIVTLGLLTALAVTPAQAQGDKQIRVDVPFSFTVSDKTLPPGEYIVSRLSPGILKFTGEEEAVLTLALVDSTSKIDTGKVVFNRYGKQYFLSRVDVEQGSLRYEMSKSRAEKKLRRSTSDQESLAIRTRSAR